MTDVMESQIGAATKFLDQQAFQRRLMIKCLNLPKNYVTVSTTMTMR